MRDNNAHMAQQHALAFDFDGWRDGSIYGTIDRELMDYDIHQISDAIGKGGNDSCFIN